MFNGVKGIRVKDLLYITSFYTTITLIIKEEEYTTFTLEEYEAQKVIEAIEKLDEAIAEDILSAEVYEVEALNEVLKVKAFL